MEELSSADGQRGKLALHKIKDSLAQLDYRNTETQRVSAEI